MSIDVGRLDRELTSRLARLAGRVRRYVLIGGVSRVAGVLIALCLFQFLLDWLLRLRWSIRAAILLAIIIGLAWVVRRWIVGPLKMRVGLDEAAHLIERRYPQLRSSLISAVQFAEGKIGSAAHNSPALAAAVVDRINGATGDLDFGLPLNHREARRSWLLMLGAAALAAVFFVTQPTIAGLWFQRNWLLSNVDWPKRTTLLIDAPEGGFVAARGDDLEIRADVVGEMPRNADVFFETESGERGRESMVRVGSTGFRYAFTNMSEGVRFHVAGGDDDTDWFDVRLVDRPAVTSAVMSVTPPTYTGLSPQTLPEGQRAVETVHGSIVDINIRTNKPIESARLVGGRDDIVAATGSGDAWSVRFQPDETRTYQFALLDELGLENKQPARFSVRLVHDENPKVRMKLPGMGDLVTRRAVLPIELEFSDDYGLARAELVCRIDREGGGEIVRPMQGLTPGARNLATRIDLAIIDLEVNPGDGISLFAQAADRDDINGPNIGESIVASFRIVSEDELLSELARREQEYRQDFEQAVEAQERLRSRLLTTLGRLGTESAGDSRAAFSSAERMQRQITSQVQLVRQQFAQILYEMSINGLSNPQAEQRLGPGIVEPLTDLARREMSDAGDLLRAMTTSLSREAASDVDPLEAAILTKMRSVLADMLQWEGFQETVTMLRDILRLQKELNDETKEEIERNAGGLFEN